MSHRMFLKCNKTKLYPQENGGHVLRDILRAAACVDESDRLTV